MDKIVILGAGGLGREVADVIDAINASGKKRWDLIGYIDENPSHAGSSLYGVPVLGGYEWAEGRDTTGIYAICGVGSPASRRHLVQRAAACGLTFANLIHPSVTLTEHITWGQGIVVTAGVILTNNIVLGDHVFINLSCTIGHDAVIEPYCNIAPGTHISGNVTLRQGCDIGTGAATVQGLDIGHWSIVGAGTVVVRDVPPNTTVVGVPGKVIKERPEGWQIA